MNLGTARCAVRRAWTVELQPGRGGPTLSCPQCPPSGLALPAVSARAAALAHLARHARHSALPAHLRTCQCHQRGCRWHPRHRGCDGEILLLLMRECGGRLWRLADMCRACAGATAHASVVPDTLLLTPRPAPPPERQQPALGVPQSLSAQQRVHEMLSYLASALPPQTGGAARLLALQCALRASFSGCVRLPSGLLRGMRLGRSVLPWRELEEARWLRRAAVWAGGTEGQVVDGPVLLQVPTRCERARAADWALRVAHSRVLRAAGAEGRLLALALAASPSSEAAGAVADALSLARVCGVPCERLPGLLSFLEGLRLLESWHLEPVTGDLSWAGFASGVKEQPEAVLVARG
ncbi:hypothetical protein ACFYVL_38975 [Streptomyces sp. NPDC004111]|uniref:hypothetical protein n=1 Tax=Streptomyces sp. NPDC004111 TaxID=3364690 RepID=UPI0036B8A6A5